MPRLYSLVLPLFLRQSVLHPLNDQGMQVRHWDPPGNAVSQAALQDLGFLSCIASGSKMTDIVQSLSLLVQKSGCQREIQYDNWRCAIRSTRRPPLEGGNSRIWTKLSGLSILASSTIALAQLTARSYM